MGVVALLTADVGDTSMLTYVGPFCTREAVARTGSYSFANEYGNSSGRYLGKSVTARADYYVKAALRASHTDCRPSIFLCDGATVHLHVSLDPSAGSLTVYRGGDFGAFTGAQLATVTGLGITTGTWYVVRVYGSIADAGGRAIVRLAGTQIVDYTGDTRNGAVAQITNIGFQNTAQFNANHFAYFDDIQIRDDAWPERGGIHVLLPTAAGDVADWTASAGNPWDCVNEKPPEFGDYLSADAAAAGTKHNFNIADSPLATLRAGAVVDVAAFAKLDAAGVGTLRTAAKSGASEAVGSGLSLTTSGQWAHNILTTDPATGAAWTKAGIDALLAGIEVV